MLLGESRNNLSADSSTPRAIPCLLFAVEKKIKSITLAFNSACRSEINLYVASRYRMPMRVVHAKRHLRNARSAIVMRHSTPSVTERVCAVPTLLRYPHALAELPYAVVHIRVERIRGREPLGKFSR